MITFLSRFEIRHARADCFRRKALRARVSLRARRHKALEHDVVIMSEWSGLINNVALVKKGKQ